MTRTSKTFLTISIIAFALSCTEAGINIGWGILRPISAVAFMLFFITNLLAKEVALYDAEERANGERTERIRRNSLNGVGVASPTSVRSSSAPERRSAA